MIKFYPHRTVEEQRARLPQAFKDNYRATVLDQVEIDGNIIRGYFEYSFLNEKSYFEQPTRSLDGSIENINTYATFLTPRLVIKYNMMNIDDYRTLMTFLKSKNTFNVTCYDIVADKRVTHEMYFANPQMPVIYQQYLAALGVQDYTIELIGTNRKPDKTHFYIGTGNQFWAYSNDTWLSYSLGLGRDVVSVKYSTKRKQFILIYNSSGRRITSSSSDSSTGVKPYDKIITGREYSAKYDE